MAALGALVFACSVFIGACYLIGRVGLWWDHRR